MRCGSIIPFSSYKVSEGRAIRVQRIAQHNLLYPHILGDSVFLPDEQPEPNLENGCPNKTENNLKLVAQFQFSDSIERL